MGLTQTETIINKINNHVCELKGSGVIFFHGAKTPWWQL